MALADDRVGFPVAQFGIGRYDGRAVVDADPVGNQFAFGWFAALLVMLSRAADAVTDTKIINK